MTFWQEIITLTCPIRREVWNLPHKFHLYFVSLKCCRNWMLRGIQSLYAHLKVPNNLYKLLLLFFFSYSSIFAMRGSPTYVINVLIVTLLPGSVGLGLHLPGSPEPNSGCRSCFRQSRILAIRLPFVFNNNYPPGRVGNTLRVLSRLYLVPSPVKVVRSL